MNDAPREKTGVRRFYRHAEAAPDGNGFTVLLDGKQVASPRLWLPTLAMAEKAAAEWNAQGDMLDPESMSFTRIAGMACDVVAERRGEIIERLVGYARTDLLCYHTDTASSLKTRQEALWLPLLSWAETRIGGAFEVTHGVIPVDQPPESLEKLRGVLEDLDDMFLTLVHLTATSCGSVFLGLALVEGEISAEKAADAALLEENFQAERWGDDPSAARRRDRIREELLEIETFQTYLDSRDGE